MYYFYLILKFHKNQTKGNGENSQNRIENSQISSSVPVQGGRGGCSQGFGVLSGFQNPESTPNP